MLSTGFPGVAERQGRDRRAVAGDRGLGLHADLLLGEDLSGAVLRQPDQGLATSARAQQCAGDLDQVDECGTVGHRAGPELVLGDDRAQSRMPKGRVEDVFDVGAVNAECGPHTGVDESPGDPVGHRCAADRCG